MKMNVVLIHLVTKSLSVKILLGALRVIAIQDILEMERIVKVNSLICI